MMSSKTQRKRRIHPSLVSTTERLPPTNESDLIKKNFEFLKDGSDNPLPHTQSSSPSQKQKKLKACTSVSYSKRVSDRYYQSLYKEYAIVDLSRYENKGQIGMRWCSSKDIRAKKGSTICAESSCTRPVTSSHEVPFQYLEHGHHKLALVKINLCHKCTKKLIKARKLNPDLS